MFKNIALLLFILITAAVTSSEVHAQQASTALDAVGPSSPLMPDALTMLPASDVIVDLNVRRMFTEALPRMLAKSPVKLAEMNRSLNQLKTMIGIDIRAVERIVIGGRMPAGGFVPTSTTVPDSVFIVQGKLDVERLVSLAGLASQGRVVKQTHNGTSVRTWTFDNQSQQADTRMFAMREISVASIDPQTLVVGTPTVVRECLDIYHAGGGSEVNSELIKLATQSPASLIAVGIKLKPGAAASNAGASSPTSPQKGLQLGGMDKIGTSPAGESTAARTAESDTFTKMFESLEQVHASIGMTALGVDALLIARTKTSEQAEELNTMLAGLRRLLESSVVKGTNTPNPFSKLNVSANGNEVRIYMQMTQNEMASLVADNTQARGKGPAATPRARRSLKAGVTAARKRKL